MKVVFENGKSLETNIEETVATTATGIGNFLKASFNVSKAAYRGTKNGLAKSFGNPTNDSLQKEIEELRAILAKMQEK